VACTDVITLTIYGEKLACKKYLFKLFYRSRWPHVGCLRISLFSC